MNSFLELKPAILSIPGMTYFLTEKLSQDPLESSLVANGSKAGPMITQRFLSSSKTHSLYVLLTVLTYMKLLKTAKGQNENPMI